MNDWIIGLVMLATVSVAVNLFLLLELARMTGLHRISWWKAPAFPRSLANLQDHSNHIDAETGVDHWQGRWDDYAGRNGWIHAGEAITDHTHPCWGNWTGYSVPEEGEKNGTTVSGMRPTVDG